VVGPDSFAPTFELTSYEVPDVSTLSSGKVGGNAPGLYAGRTYGGTGKNICDVEAMIRFLTHYEDRGRAWAAVQGIPYEQLPAYLRGLTPVYALQNLNVKMFGFKNGQSYGYDAVIAAGTAILIDGQGMPRARCACGNPLLGPKEDQPTPLSETTPPDAPGDTGGDDQPNDSNVPDEPNNPDDPDDPNTPCPESDGAGAWTDYTAPNGQRWAFLLADDQWHNLDDPEAPPVSSIDELPGWIEQCGNVSLTRIPDCPSPLGPDGWTTYQDLSGDTWIYDPVFERWKNIDAENQVVDSLLELPDYEEQCLGPIDGQPACPSPVGDGWTPYQSTTGEIWTYEMGDNGVARWVNQDTGEEAAIAEEIPGYIRDCGGPVECPPSTAAIGDQYIDENGHLWEFREQPEDYPAWDDLSTTINEEVSPTQFFSDNCDGYGFDGPPTNTCPPNYAVAGTIWFDSQNFAWEWNNHTGGAFGWDNLATDDIEVLDTWELPNQPEDCQYPERQVECPPITPTEGWTYVGSNGHTYVYSEGITAWIDADDGTALPISYTALLPGYQDDCLPPCPPENISSTETGVWLDPSTGELWIHDTELGRWTNTADGSSVSMTQDLPFWAEWCLPPCVPSDSGPSNSYAFDGDQPITDPSAAASYGEFDDKSVTVEPSQDGPTIEPIADERVQATGATSDDCNPYGCVEGEPQLGWTFIDSDGMQWWYTSGGRFMDERGRTVSFITDIPGYDELCNPATDVPVGAPCPPEVKSDPYIDSNGLDWYWVGSNATEAESDHGRNWYHRYSDGSVAYKATIELESWFANCPPPTDPTVEVNPGSLSVGFSAHTLVCVGETIDLRVFVTPTPDAAVNDVGISVNGENIELTDVGGNTWTGSYQATAAGELTVVAGASDTSGATDSYTSTIIVRECDEATEDSTPDTTTGQANRAPTIKLLSDDLCVEIESTDPAPVNVLVRVDDPDDDDLTVVVLATADTGPIERDTYRTTGRNSRTVTFTLDYSYRGKTITIEGTVTDGELTDEYVFEIEGTYPGGCSTPTTSSSYAPATSPPSTADPSNTMPTLTQYTKALPSCLSSTGFTIVQFRVTDPEGATVGIQAKVAGSIAVGGTSPSSGPSGQIFAVNLRAADAGKTLTVTGTDFVNVTAPISVTIPSAICA
jgi:hypothetical protein